MLQSNFIEITIWYGFSPVNLMHNFRTHFTKNTSGQLPLHDERITRIELGSFTLLVNEEMGIESQMIFGKLPQKILDKPYLPFPVVVHSNIPFSLSEMESLGDESKLGRTLKSYVLKS